MNGIATLCSKYSSGAQYSALGHSLILRAVKGPGMKGLAVLELNYFASKGFVEDL